MVRPIRNPAISAMPRRTGSMKGMKRVPSSVSRVPDRAGAYAGAAATSAPPGLLVPAPSATRTKPSINRIVVHVSPARADLKVMA
jgi:hypothetical protein